MLNLSMPFECPFQFHPIPDEALRTIDYGFMGLTFSVHNDFGRYRIGRPECSHAQRKRNVNAFCRDERCLTVCPPFAPILVILAMEHDPVDHF